MKLYLSILLICLTYCANAQTDGAIWKNWDKNYPKQDILTLLRSERLYATDVEKNPKIAPFYVRMAGYRFKASFLGETKHVDAEMMLSMQRVLTLNQRDPNQVKNLVDSVVLMKVGQKKIWMAIQKNLLPQLRREVAKGGVVILYCAFLNEHTIRNKLFNNFLISEFTPGKVEGQ